MTRLLRRTRVQGVAPPPPELTISTFFPQQAPVGTQITVVGTFGPVGTVTGARIGGTLGIFTQVSTTQVLVAVPSGTLGGKIRIETAAGFAVSVDDFTVTTPLTGDYAHLFDQDNTALLPLDATPGAATPRMRPNTSSGLHDGTSVYTIEPVWGDTRVVTGLVTGDSATNEQKDANREAIQAVLNDRAVNATTNTEVVVASGTVWRGTLVLPPNLANVWIGLVPSGKASLPSLSPPTTTGLVRPTKANRLQPSHFPHTIRGEVWQSNVPMMKVATGQVRKYWVRGVIGANPSNVVCNTLFDVEPNQFLLGPVLTASATTTTHFQPPQPNGIAESVTGGFRYAQIIAGTGAGQLRRIQTWTRNAPGEPSTLVVTAPWSTLPDTASEFRYLDGAMSGTVGGAVTTGNDVLPEDIFFMQCGGRGVAGAGCQTVRTAILAGRRIAWCDGYTELMGVTGQDPQDVLVTVGAGPHKYTNNESYVRGPKETWMAGGRGLTGFRDEWLPRNIELRYNKCRDIADGLRKTTLEVKYGTHGIMECNDASEQRANIFPGEFTLKLTNQEVLANLEWADTAHWTIRMNNADNAGGVVCVTSREAAGPETMPTNIVRNVVVAGNVQRNANKLNRGLTLGGELQNVLVLHNTVNGGTATGEFAQIFWFPNSGGASYASGPNIRMLHNVGCNPNMARPDWVVAELQPAALLAKLGAGSAISGNLLNVSATDARFANNIRAGVSPDAIGFVNRLAGDVRLAPSSPGYQAINGKDVGADVALVNFLMADVV